jgi:uncharacterized protein YbjT (DUF2867 family)
MSEASRPVIAVMGASGLIGQYLCEWLMSEGFAVRPVARRFTSAQEVQFGVRGLERDFANGDAKVLADLLDELDADLVVNCIGVLQDGPSGSTRDIHAGFVDRLQGALALKKKPALIVHISIPRSGATNTTAFSRTKRDGEALLTGGDAPFAILRPGFVIAPNAFGGSALMRSLAALPLALPAQESAAPLSVTAASDIALTIGSLARRWGGDEHDIRVAWDVMSDQPTSVGDIISGFRDRFGGPRRRMPLPSWLLSWGSLAGDAVAWLGWMPPIRSTALTEMRRGVTGDPAPWIAATGIVPSSLDETLRRLHTSLQEKWFGRTYLLKGLIFPVLAIFWIVSGLIALLASFGTASAILTHHGFPAWLSNQVTLATSIADIAIGLAIAVRRTSAAGLVVGILVSLGYMVGAAFITPELWIEPLGALVKTFPAIVLMLVALAILDER